MKAYIKMVLFLFVLSAISAVILTGFSIETRERIEKNRKHEQLIHAMKTMRLLPKKVEQQLETDKLLNSLPDKTDKDKFDKAATRIERMEYYLKQQNMQELLEVFDAQVTVLEIPKTDPRRIYIYQGQEFVKSSRVNYLNNIYIMKTSVNGINRYCFEISGAGFWDKISGFMALGQGLEDFVGISFYDDKETPGLGQRIEEGWFQAQFTHWHKKIFAGEDSRPQFHVTPQAGRYLGDSRNSVKPVNEIDAITGASETSRALDRFITQNLRSLLIKMAQAIENEKARNFFDSDSRKLLKKMQTLKP